MGSRAMNQTMVEKENTPAIAFVALITGCVLWGSGAAVGKIALSAYNPIFLVIMRLILAFVVFTPIIIWRFWPIRLQRKKDALIFLLLILCDPIGFFTFEALALKYTSATQAGMMWAIAPMLNTMLAWVVLREKTSLPVILCFITAMGGGGRAYRRRGDFRARPQSGSGKFLRAAIAYGGCRVCNHFAFFEGALSRNAGGLDSMPLFQHIYAAFALP